MATNALDRSPKVIDPDLADRIIASILVNGDSVPPLVMLTASAASETRSTIAVATIRADLAAIGFRFDDDGDLVDSPVDVSSALGKLGGSDA